MDLEEAALLGSQVRPAEAPKGIRGLDPRDRDPCVVMTPFVLKLSDSGPKVSQYSQSSPYEDKHLLEGSQSPLTRTTDEPFSTGDLGGPEMASREREWVI